MDFTLSPEPRGVQEKAQPLAREVTALSARLDRDAKAGQIHQGTNEIMRLIIARSLLKG
jgi:alkylation response protein AidB-like acyl-CoA dehydrogenase